MWLKEFENINPHYLKFALTNYVEQLKAMARGSAYSALTIEKLKKYRISLPSIATQKKIVEQLEGVNTISKSIKDTYNRKINNLEELKKSLLQQAFSGKLTQNRAETVKNLAAEPNTAYNE